MSSNVNNINRIFNHPIYIGDRMEHIVLSHGSDSNDTSKSHFLVSEKNKIIDIILKAFKMEIVSQKTLSDRVVFEINMNEPIGKTINSDETDTIRIVIGLSGELISAFPVEPTKINPVRQQITIADFSIKY